MYDNESENKNYYTKNIKTVFYMIKINNK